MRQNPVRISGQGQLDTDLNAADGAFVAKEGAEGTLAIGCVGPGFGVALTVDDGDKTRRAAKVIALTALSGLGVLDEDTERQLRESQWPAQIDPLGRSVGEFRPAFRVNPVHRGRTNQEFSVGNRDARA
jgi:L-asparaginase II